MCLVQYCCAVFTFSVPRSTVSRLNWKLERVSMSERAPFTPDNPKSTRELAAALARSLVLPEHAPVDYDTFVKDIQDMASGFADVIRETGIPSLHIIDSEYEGQRCWKFARRINYGYESLSKISHGRATYTETCIVLSDQGLIGVGTLNFNKTFITDFSPEFPQQYIPRNCVSTAGDAQRVREAIIEDLQNILLNGVN